MDFDAKDFISTMVHGINFQSKFVGIAKMGGKASGIERARRAYMKQSAREIILKMHYFYEAEEELEAEWKEFQRWRRRKKKRSTSRK